MTGGLNAESWGVVVMLAYFAVMFLGVLVVGAYVVSEAGSP